MVMGTKPGALRLGTELSEEVKDHIRGPTGLVFDEVSLPFVVRR